MPISAQLERFDTTRAGACLNKQHTGRQGVHAILAYVCCTCLQGGRAPNSRFRLGAMDINAAAPPVEEHHPSMGHIGVIKDRRQGTIFGGKDMQPL